MVDEEYKKSCTEVLEILSYLSKEDYKKIPTDVINALEYDKDLNYNFKYDVNRTLDEQGVLNTTKIIIAMFFRDYWATEKQRNIILNYEKNCRNKLEEEKRKEHNPNEIFKIKEDENNKKKANQALIEIKKEKWYKKVIRQYINKILKIFKIKQIKK